MNAALRFLKAANAALKHGSFSEETLQRLVTFKDKILSILSDQTRISTGNFCFIVNENGFSVLMV